MKTISYAITVNNEIVELKRLVDQIFNHIRSEDEIVIVQDRRGLDSYDQNCLDIKRYLEKIAEEKSNVKYFSFYLNKNFADFKNKLKKECKKDYIIFLDADEYMSNTMADQLHNVVENNDIDLFMVPRLNTVSGLTQEDIQKWHWRVDEKGRVNWPDFQTRLVANKSYITWIGAVHEKIEGYRTVSHFPFDNEEWCLIHPKTIEKQRLQNSFYEKI